jgi:hypothetical protein
MRPSKTLPIVQQLPWSTLMNPACSWVFEVTRRTSSTSELSHLLYFRLQKEKKPSRTSLSSLDSSAFVNWKVRRKCSAAISMSGGIFPLALGVHSTKHIAEGHCTWHAPYIWIPFFFVCELHPESEEKTFIIASALFSSIILTRLLLRPKYINLFFLI